MKSEKDAELLAAEETEMRDEYDFSDLQKVDREKFFARLAKARAQRLLTPELAKEFPDDESVNAALREYIELKRKSD